MKDSLQKQYTYKVFTNLVGLFSSLVIAGVVPRALGPIAYGNFSFLTDFFSRIISFFDAGTSSAFYTKLSQEPHKFSIISFYKLFIGLVLVIIIVFTIAMHYLKISETLWPNQEITYIIMALIFTFLTWVVRISQKTVDAYSLTVLGEKVRMFNRVILAIIVTLMFSLGYLTLASYFVMNYVSMIVLGFGLFIILTKRKVPVLKLGGLPWAEIKKYIKSFYLYTTPLIVLSLFVLVGGVLERWLIQFVSGPEQQAYFGLSSRIARICFIFTSAAIPLIMREFAVAKSNNDFIKLSKIFYTTAPLLFFVAAFISIFVSINARTVALVFGGQQFVGAGTSLIIMSLYPIHQTLGQVSGAYFLGTGHTIIYSRISMIFIAIGIPISFILLAPDKMFGLEMGALGLAIKMVTIQIVGINTQLWYLAKELKINFKNILYIQIKPSLMLFVCAMVAKVLSQYFVTSSIIFDLLVAGLIYSTSVLISIILMPGVINMNRDKILILFDKVIT